MVHSIKIVPSEFQYWNQICNQAAGDFVIEKS